KDLLYFAHAQMEFAYSKNVAVTNYTRNFEMTLRIKLDSKAIFPFRECLKSFMVLYSSFVDPPKFPFLRRT
ncbi:hypothetical protein, partial [Nostoc sp.]|uniref:hypothetical protein n=1 Tax=Nostoc sp. TaxID=1180 RepID=UPI002FF7100A